MTSRPTITPTEAAEKVFAALGYVVIAYPPLGDDLHPGDDLNTYGGAYISKYRLKVVSRCTRREWDKQFKLMFPRRKEMVLARGSRYYRCELVRRTAC